MAICLALNFLPVKKLTDGMDGEMNMENMKCEPSEIGVLVGKTKDLSWMECINEYGR